MSQPIASVVHTARSPEEAKLLAARLQAEGIPATVEGDGLVDEFAMSRRLMNLLAVRVMVPTSSLERAREILGPVEVDDDELERQALAADGGETPAPEAAPRPAVRISWWPLVVASSAALTFFVLWLRETKLRESTQSPFFAYETIPGGLVEIDREHPDQVTTYFDDDGDGKYERIATTDAEGRPVGTSTDRDRDGRIDEFVQYVGDLTVKWTYANAEDSLMSCVVTDAQGKIVQRLVWRDGKGYVVEDR
jgi:hypothetical protein